MARKSKYIIDTNVFLRFLLNDIPRQAEQAAVLFRDAQDQKIEASVAQITLFEIQFILEKYYEFPKAEIAEKLKSLLASEFLQIQDREVFLTALRLYESSSIDFVDTFLPALAESEGGEVFTFDKKMKRGEL